MATNISQSTAALSPWNCRLPLSIDAPPTPRTFLNFFTRSFASSGVPTSMPSTQVTDFPFFPARVTPTRTCCLAMGTPRDDPVPEPMLPGLGGLSEADDDAPPPPFALRSARMDPFPASAMASSMDIRPSSPMEASLRLLSPSSFTASSGLSGSFPRSAWRLANGLSPPGPALVTAVVRLLTGFAHARR